MAQRSFLVFRLSGLMSAWGDIAVGERRSIWAEPSKSGVLGLVAAAMGLCRDQDHDHQVLEDALGFAVRVDEAGNPLRDYHTAQAPKERRNLRWRMRRDELADGDNLNTVLSERFYRLEARATVVLWIKAEGVSLADLVTALNHPHFGLSLGRKTCPLAEPLWPQIIEAEGLSSALAQYDQAREPKDEAVLRQLPRVRRVVTQTPAIWFELEAGLAEDQDAIMVRQRRDRVRTRSRHVFSERREGRLGHPLGAEPERDLLEGIVA